MFDLILVLALITLANYGLGLYKNLALFSYEFEYSKALKGAVNGLLVIFALYALSYSLIALEKTGVDVSSVMPPLTIVKLGILGYVAKVSAKLSEILSHNKTVVPQLPEEVLPPALPEVEEPEIEVPEIEEPKEEEPAIPTITIDLGGN